MKQALNYYKNNKTGKIISKWETEKAYCSHSHEFYLNYTQVGGLV